MNGWLGRLIRWLIVRIGAITLLQLTLLWLVLEITAGGLAAMVPAVKQSGAFWVVILATILGWRLGRRRFSGWLAIPLSTLCGVATLLLTIGQMHLPIRGLFPPLMILLYQGKTALPALEQAWQELLEASATLGARFALWWQVVRGGQVILDPLVTALLWGLGLWLISSWASWFMRRYRTALLSLLPAIGLLAYVGYYTNSTRAFGFLAWSAGIAILLQGAGNYAERLEHWARAQLDRADIESELAMTVFGVATILTVTGVLLPSISIREIADRIQKAWEQRRQEELARSLGIEKTPLPARPATSGTNRGWSWESSTELPILGSPELSTETLFYVQVEGYHPLPPAARLYGYVRDTSPRFYWRAQTFDRYNGYGWTALEATQQEFLADEPILPESLWPGLANLLPLHQQVERVREGEALIFAGVLASVDQPYLVWWRSPGDLAKAQTKARLYRATSYLPQVTVTQLRQAGSDYPPQILQRYLQLPPGLPTRVRDLALDLTARQPTSYDKAVAIEAYLRGFPYDTHAPAPPPGRDVVDFFLFDLQKGYCNYYATAMAVLARASGLPSRLVIGYAAGNFDFQNNRFVVVDANAHTWAEIYFPGIGWIEFEPTASIPALERPIGEAEGYSLPPLRKPTDRGSSPQLIVFRIWLKRAGEYALRLFPLGILLILLPLPHWILYFYSPQKAVQVIYRRLRQGSYRLGLRPDPALTPYEFALQLKERLRSGLWAQTTHLAFETDLNRLTDLYMRSWYAPFPPSRQQQREAIRCWASLRRRLRNRR